MVEHSGVRQQDVQQPGALAELECVAALVAQQCAHVYGEVLLVGERGEEGEAEPIVVGLLIQVSGEPVVRPEIVCKINRL